MSDMSDQELNHFNLDGRIELLHVLAIMTRASHNRQIFKVSEGLQSLVNLMKGIGMVASLMSCFFISVLFICLKIFLFHHTVIMFAFYGRGFGRLLD